MRVTGINTKRLLTIGDKDIEIEVCDPKSPAPSIVLWDVATGREFEVKVSEWDLLVSEVDFLIAPLQPESEEV